MKDSSLQQHNAAMDFVAFALPNAEPSQQTSPLLCLPLELRRVIYQHGLPDRDLDFDKARAIYCEDLHNVRIDQPSPFLMSNKQIQREFSEIMRHSEVSLRITGQGIAFTEAGLSACIAQDIRGDLSKASHLHVAIWPPHSRRPVESLYIYNSVQNLRDKLTRYPGIKNLALEFGGSWTMDGRIPSNLPWGTSDYAKVRWPKGMRIPVWMAPCFMDDAVPKNDLAALLTIFATVTNVEKPTIHLSPAFHMDEKTRGYNIWTAFAVAVCLTMQGHKATRTKFTFIDELGWSTVEDDMKRGTACLAWQKLHNLTNGGERKMSEASIMNWCNADPISRPFLMTPQGNFRGNGTM